MPIEFRCTSCNKLLRVRDEAAGRQAKCPECETVLQVPAASAPSTVPAEPPPPVQPPPVAAAPPPAGESENPYQSPMAEEMGQATDSPAEFGAPLAGRWTRLVGVFIDSVIYSIPLIPFYIMLGVASVSEDFENVGPDFSVGMIVFSVVGFIVFIAVLAIQWYMISTRGQSIGKRILGIRIILISDGAAPGFVKGVILRLWVVSLLGAFPLIGGIFSLANALFIFREDRRCIHDLIAGTRVVEA